MNKQEIKLSYTPEQGMITNLRNVRAVAPDGTRWYSINNRWRRVHAKEEQNIVDYAAHMKWVLRILGFSLGMTFFAAPIEMSFGFDNPGGWIALLCICAFCGSISSRFLR